MQEHQDHHHDHAHKHGADACWAPSAKVNSGPEFRAGRAYKVRGLDCAEEVAILMQAVGPLVGRERQTSFRCAEWPDDRRLRFKPILLTALAAMIGAATILLDPIFQGLAISLLFGLASSTLLTVLVIPAIYVVLRADTPSAARAD